VEIEDKIREWIRQMGEDTQSLVLGGMDRYRHKGKQCCPQCGEWVYWERYEPWNYITTVSNLQAALERVSALFLARIWRRHWLLAAPATWEETPPA
jgi:hypothetical protein